MFVSTRPANSVFHAPIVCRIPRDDRPCADATSWLYAEAHPVCVGLRNKSPSVQSERRVLAGLLGCLATGIAPPALLIFQQSRGTARVQLVPHRSSCRSATIINHNINGGFTTPQRPIQLPSNKRRESDLMCGLLARRARRGLRLSADGGNTRRRSPRGLGPGISENANSASILRASGQGNVRRRMGQATAPATSTIAPGSCR